MSGAPDPLDATAWKDTIVGYQGAQYIPYHNRTYGAKVIVSCQSARLVEAR